MSEAAYPDLAGLLQALVQQQTAMVQVQVESLRLQRLLIERVLGAPAAEHGTEAAALLSSSPTWTTSPFTHIAPPPTTTSTSAPSEQPAPADTIVESEPNTIEPWRAKVPGDVPAGAPEAEVQNGARGARYYQRPTPTGARIVKPEEVELMRRLQEMRDASDLILQFGPFKGRTLAQVAMHNPEYIRQLVTGAQRPEVRAAASRLVEALDAAAEHKRRTTRGARRGRTAR